MVVTTLIVCFLLALLPLVISTFSFRYAPNIFSRAILALSTVSFLIGLVQFGLLLGLSYRLFEPLQMEKASRALQYVSIVGGSIMIVAGALWVGYFRRLIRSQAPANQALRAEEVQPVAAAAPRSAVRKRREPPEPDRDWFSDEVPEARTFKLAVTAPPKPASGRRPAARAGSAATKPER